MPDTFWFDPDSLRALCEDGPWMRGKALLAQGVVGEPDIEPLDEGWRIQALVQGTQHLPYEVAVTLAVMPDGQVDYWRSVCDCPVGRQCKHAVALMLKAARLPLSDEARAAAAPRKGVSAAAASLSARERMAAVQQAEAQAQLVNWLAALDRAAGGDVVLSPTDRSARPEQYLYLLSVVGGMRQPVQLQLEAVVSYPKVTGGWAKPKQVRTQPAKGQAVYDQASETDRQVLQLLRAMPRSQAYYSAYSGAPARCWKGRWVCWRCNRPPAPGGCLPMRVDPPWATPCAGAPHAPCSGAGTKCPPSRGRCRPSLPGSCALLLPVTAARCATTARPCSSMPSGANAGR